MNRDSDPRMVIVYLMLSALFVLFLILWFGLKALAKGGL